MKNFGSKLWLIGAIVTAFALSAFGSVHLVPLAWAGPAALSIMIGEVSSVADLAAFEVMPELQQTAIAYHNEDLVSDEILPRVPVTSQAYSYRYYDPAQFLTVTDTHVGRTSEPNLVEFGSTLLPGRCEPYGLDDIIPKQDIDNASPGNDPQAIAVEGIMSIVELDREIRVANMFAAGGSFATAYPNQTVANAAYNSSSNPASGAFKILWSDKTNSDPIAQLLYIMDTMLRRPNKLFMPQPTWTLFKKHPAVIKDLYGVASQRGTAKDGDVTDRLEIEKLVIGKPWYNAAKKGQASDLRRVWSNVVLMWYENGNPTAQGQPTFGITPQWGPRIAGAIPDQKRGLKGSMRVRAGEYVDEKIVAPLVGYLITNVA